MWPLRYPNNNIKITLRVPQGDSKFKCQSEALED